MVLRVSYSKNSLFTTNWLQVDGTTTDDDQGLATCWLQIGWLQQQQKKWQQIDYKYKMAKSLKLSYILIAEWQQNTNGLTKPP